MTGLNAVERLVIVWRRKRVRRGLSIFDQFPEKYIWEPSERMKQWWKEYEEKQSEVEK